jgi:3',5'-cyclic AMP phosphodiesterase CpdA
MKASIERQDYLSLVEAFAAHPDFRTEDGRWKLVDEAFRGISGSERAKGGLDLRDPPRNAAGSLVGRLLDFGRLGERHSLALVVETLQERVGDDERGELDRLIRVLDGRQLPAPGPAPAASPNAQILHLSDLHFGTVSDACNFHSQLAEDLKRELGCTRLDGLICSGDLTLVSSEAEYEAARTFIDLLRRELGLARERIVLVPGNHDLSWPLAQAAYVPADASVYAAANEHEQRRWIVEGETCMVRDEDRYRQRFAPYGKRLHRLVTGESYPLDYPDQFSLHHWPELSLLVLGLNSAWEIDHAHRDRAGIHPEAISKALNLLRARPDWADCLEVAVWHHPLASDEPSHIKDHGFLERLAAAGFRLALHGHIHKAEVTQFRYDRTPGGRRLDILAAGTFGAPSHQWVPGYPLQYQLLRLGSGGVTVETRRREEPNGTWKPDARWLQGPGQDPVPRYFVELRGAG